MRSQYTAPPMSAATIEALTWQLRQILGWDERPFLPVTELVEFGIPLLTNGAYEYDVRALAEMGDDHGRVEFDEKLLVLREDVYDGVNENRGRDRFTACHEVGHVVLHDGRRLSRALPSGHPIKAYLDPEWQANRFAGALLMPKQMVLRFSTIEQVMREFGVTRDAATVRMRQVTR
jgi:hypothetical protein